MKLTIEVTQGQYQHLESEAKRLGITVEQEARRRVVGAPAAQRTHEVFGRKYLVECVSQPANLQWRAYDCETGECLGVFGKIDRYVAGCVPAEPKSEGNTKVLLEFAELYYPKSSLEPFPDYSNSRAAKG